MIARCGEIRKMEEILSFKRRPEMDIRAFWRKYKAAKDFAVQAGVAFSGDVLFSQAFKALGLNTAQKQLILTMFETTQAAKTAQELQRLSLRLFASYGTAFGSTFEVTAGDRDIIESGDEGGDCAWYAKGKEGNPKKRIGFEETSVRKTTGVMNPPNGYQAMNEQDDYTALGGKGNGKRIRCQSKDHFWRQCPIPLKRSYIPVGANQRPYEGKRKKQRRKNKYFAQKKLHSRSPARMMNQMFPSHPMKV